MGSALLLFSLISPANGAKSSFTSFLMFTYPNLYFEWKFYSHQQLSEQRKARYNFCHIESVSKPYSSLKLKTIQKFCHRLNTVPSATIQFTAQSRRGDCKVFCQRKRLIPFEVNKPIPVFVDTYCPPV